MAHHRLIDTQRAARPTEEREPMGLLDELDKIKETGGGRDIVNVDLQKKDRNRIRIISAPVAYFKHWDTPNGSERSVVPCLKNPYTGEGDCPFCKLNAKNPKFFTPSLYTAFNVVQDGQVKILEINQKSIRNAIKGYEDPEKQPDWAEVVQGDIRNIELVIVKEKKNGKTSYTVSPPPRTGPLSAEEMENYEGQCYDLAKLKRILDPSVEADAEKLADIISKVVMTVPDPESEAAEK